MKTRRAGNRVKMTDNADDDADREQSTAQENDENGDGLASPPPMKRHKSGGSSKRPKKSTSGKTDLKHYRGRNVGKLANMFQMPVEIICEIATHMGPLDLLNLARSTKPLHNLLMSRNSKSIWRVARANIDGLPDCPPDLSEPAYARLIFEKYCHGCLTARVMKVDYVLRARFCQRCTQSNIVKGSFLIKSIPGLTVALLECLPCRKRDTHRDARSQYFHKDQVKALLAEYRSAVPESIQEAERMVLQQEFYSRRQKVVEEAIEHAASLERWVYKDQVSRRIQGADTARRRESSIKAKLMELGYQPSDFPTRWEDTEWVQIMGQPRDLTPRIWTKVRPKLVATIERVKKERENVKRQGRERDRRLELLPFMDCLIQKRKKQDAKLAMAVSEALCLPTAVALMKEDDFNEVITQTRWDAVLSQVEKEMDEFAEHARDYLTGLISASLPSSSGSASSVNHAPAASADGENDGHHETVSLNSAFFRCTECPQSVSLSKYPALLGHGHALTSIIFDTTLDQYSNLLLPFLGEFDDKKLTIVGTQFQCLRCKEELTFPMDWFTLVTHFRREQARYDIKRSSGADDPSFVKFEPDNDHDIRSGNLDLPTCRVLDPQEAWMLAHGDESDESDEYGYGDMWDDDGYGGMIDDDYGVWDEDFDIWGEENYWDGLDDGGFWGCLCCA